MYLDSTEYPRIWNLLQQNPAFINLTDNPQTAAEETLLEQAEELVETIERTLEEELEEQANRDAAITWSTLSEDEDEYQFTVAYFGNAVAVNGDILPETDAVEIPEGYELTNRGGFIPTTESIIWREHLIDAVLQELENIAGMAVTNELVEAVAQEILGYDAEEIPRSVSGEADVYQLTQNLQFIDIIRNRLAILLGVENLEDSGIDIYMNEDEAEQLIELLIEKSTPRGAFARSRERISSGQLASMVTIENLLPYIRKSAYAPPDFRAKPITTYNALKKYLETGDQYIWREYVRLLAGQQPRMVIQRRVPLQNAEQVTLGELEQFIY